MNIEVNINKLTSKLAQEKVEDYFHYNSEDIYEKK